jgi:acyl carrier protein
MSLRGIEVLVRKASVDPEFRSALLDQRAAAARIIGLVLEPAEEALLAAVPASQLEAIIARTVVPQEHRRTFLGQAAAAMIAALGAMAVPASAQVLQGIGPDRPPVAMGGGGMGGVRADLPPGAIGGGGIRPEGPQKPVGPVKPGDPPAPTAIERRVVAIVARRFKVQQKDVTRETSLTIDLRAEPADLVKLKAELEKEFKLKIPGKEFKNLRTVGQLAAYFERTVQPPPNPAANAPRSSPYSGGWGMGGMGADRPRKPPSGGTFGNRPN